MTRGRVSAGNAKGCEPERDPETMIATQAAPKPRRDVWRFAVPIWAAALLAAGYFPTLAGIGGSWFDPNADMGHGFAVPIVAAYMAWTKRDELRELHPAPNWWGLLVVLWGTLQFVVSSAADWIFATRISFLISLLGCLISLYGVAVVRTLAYPLGLLFMMITPPTFLQAQLTLQLQLIASRLAERWLDVLGFSVLRDGNILEMVGERLAVAEACSGIRSLSALMFFCLTYCFFLVPKISIRALLIAAVIPVAVFGNAVRIVLTGVVGQYNKELAHGMLHEAWGYITVLIAGVFLVALHAGILRAWKGWRVLYG